MIITAMYLYGIIQGTWSFEMGAIVFTFLADLILVSALGIGEKK